MLWMGTSSIFNKKNESENEKNPKNAGECAKNAGDFQENNSGHKEVHKEMLGKKKGGPKNKVGPGEKRAGRNGRRKEPAQANERRHFLHRKEQAARFHKQKEHEPWKEQEATEERIEVRGDLTKKKWGEKPAKS